MVPYATAYVTLSHFHTPLGRLSMVDISTAVEIVPVPKRSALKKSRREFSEDMTLGSATIGSLLVVEQLSLEIRPRRGGYIHRCLRYWYTSCIKSKELSRVFYNTIGISRVPSPARY